MTVDPLQPTETVQAELVLWRVLGLNDVFEDRPAPEWSVGERRGPGAEDELRVAIGDLPTDLTLTVRQWRAQASGALDWLVGRLLTEEKQRAQYEHSLHVVDLHEFDEPYPLWFSLKLARPLRVQAAVGAVVGWMASDGADVHAALSKFEDEGNQYLDGVLGRMLAATGFMSFGHLRFPGRRAFLTAPGRAALAIPRTQMSIKDAGVRIRRNAGWSSAPTEAITAVVRALPRGKQIEKRTADPAGWLSAALAEEADDLRRFVFAFVGLEMLATLTEKVSRERLVQRMTDLESRLPVVALLWSGTNKDLAQRNLVFRFAAMATVLSPNTAQADVAVFKQLADVRNDLFHGKEKGGVGRSASVRCQELLRRYLGLTATAELIDT